MGVNGLWPLLKPAARPVSMESLAGKVLAIDVSMWLHQMMKGMRDRYGNSVQYAHLIGLFHHICKLLFYQIRPVFVFDGGVPHLKRRIMECRRKARQEAKSKSQRDAKRLLSNELKQRAMNHVLGIRNQPGTSTQPNATAISPDKDLFELPDMIPVETATDEMEDAETSIWEERMNQRDAIYAEFQSPEKIDLESFDFKALPSDVQLEILMDMKETQKMNSWSTIDDMPQESHDFSNYQISKLMKKSRLTTKINAVREELNTITEEDLAELSKHNGAAHIERRKFVSEDRSHYVLITGLKKPDPEDPTIGQTVQYDVSAPQPSLRKDEVTSDLCNSETLQGSNLRAVIDNPNEINNELSIGQDIEENTYNEVNRVLNDNDDHVIDNKVQHIHADLKENNGGIDIKAAHDISKSARNEQRTVCIDDRTSEMASADKKIPAESVKVEDLEIDLVGTGTCSDSKMQLSTSECVPLNENAVISEERKLEGSTPFIGSSVDVVNIKDDDVDVKSHEGAAAMEVIVDKDAEAEEVESDEDFIEVADHVLPDSGTDAIASEEPHLKRTETAVLVSSGDDHEASEDDEEENYFASAVTQKDVERLQSSLAEENAQLNARQAKEQRAASTITEQMQQDAQELLRLFGVPYIVSPQEAEAQCAHLDASGQTDGCITDDSDVWLFGARRVYRHVFSRHGDSIESYTANDVQSQLLLDRPAMIKLALLTGSDYTQGIVGVGPVTAMEIISEFPAPGFDGLQDFRDWWLAAKSQEKVGQESRIKSKLRLLNLSDDFPSRLVVDSYLNPSVDESKEVFSWSTPDLHLLRQFAEEKFCWSRQKVDGMLLPLFKQLNKVQPTQPHITGYLMPSAIGTNKHRSSRRVKAVINRMRSSVAETTDTSDGHIPADRHTAAKKATTKRQHSTAISSAQSGGFLSSQPPLELQLSEDSSDDNGDVKLREPRSGKGDKKCKSVNEVVQSKRGKTRGRRGARGKAR